MTRKSRLLKQKKRADRQNRPRSRMPAPPPPPTQRPLPDLSSLDPSRYSWGWGRGAEGDQASMASREQAIIDRLLEQGIGLAEVYAALVHPEVTVPASRNHSNRRMHIRGDIGVVLESGHTIITVIDRLNGSRTSPRVALVPPNVPTESISLSERQPLMPTNSSKGADKDLGNGTGNTPDWSAIEGTPDAVAHWVLAREPGDQFTISEMSTAFAPNPHFSISAIRQQVLAWTYNRHLFRVDRGLYRVEESAHAHARSLLELEDSPPPAQDTAQGMTVGQLDQAAAELDDQPIAEVVPEPAPLFEQPEPAQPTEQAVVEPELMVLHNGKSTMTLTAEWGTPPPPQSGPHAFIEGVRYHIAENVVAQLKERPGQWMRILVIEGGAKPVVQATKQVAIYERENLYHELDFAVREMPGGQSAGVWVRWNNDKPATNSASTKTTRAAKEAAKAA